MAYDFRGSQVKMAVEATITKERRAGVASSPFPLQMVYSTEMTELDCRGLLSTNEVVRCCA